MKIVCRRCRKHPRLLRIEYCFDCAKKEIKKLRKAVLKIEEEREKKKIASNKVLETMAEVYGGSITEMRAAVELIRKRNGHAG